MTSVCTPPLPDAPVVRLALADASSYLAEVADICGRLGITHVSYVTLTDAGALVLMQYPALRTVAIAHELGLSTVGSPLGLEYRIRVGRVTLMAYRPLAEVVAEYERAADGGAR
jgi:hypothetical protein